MALEVTIGKEKLQVPAKTFSTGSHGFYGRFEPVTIDGKPYLVMITITDKNKG